MFRYFKIDINAVLLKSLSLSDETFYTLKYFKKIYAMIKSTNNIVSRLNI